MMSTVAAPIMTSQRLRRLQWHELVCRGDFVEDGHEGFEPLEGPSGFRADAFVKQIYRQLRPSSPAATK